jgi:hypothetical protein
MLVQEKKFQDKDGVLAYYEGFYDSSNILNTTYYPHTKTLYISFNRGGVYSYANVNEELYEEFKNAESQGKFFAQTIKLQSQKYPYRKEFSLYPSELEKYKEVVEENKPKEENELVFHEDNTMELPVMSVSDTPDNTIRFSVGNEEVIVINLEGFHWKGKLIQEDKEIYERFKLWLDMAFSKISFIKDEESGVVELLKKVLNFYANKDNYEQNTHLNEELTSMIELDEGEQARQVLGLVGSLEKEGEKMEKDYEKIMQEELKNVGDPDKMKNIIDAIKNSNKDDN